MGRIIQFIDRWTGILVLLLTVSLIIFPIGVYRDQFGTSLSEKRDDFGTFGDFMNPFLALVSIVLLGFISYRAFLTTRNYNNVQLRPHLFLQEVPYSIDSGLLVWEVSIVSEAPAVNVFIRVDSGNNSFSKWILCPPFSKTNPTLKLTWIKRAIAIEVMYTDITSQYLYGITVKDRLHKITKINKAKFNCELSRNRDNSDFHISLPDFYKNSIINQTASPLLKKKKGKKKSK